MVAEQKKPRKPLLAAVERTMPEQIAAVLTPRALFIWLNSIDQGRTFEPRNRNWNAIAYYLRHRNVEFPQVERDTVRYLVNGEERVAALPQFAVEYLRALDTLGEKYEQITISQALAALVVEVPNCADAVAQPHAELAEAVGAP